MKKIKTIFCENLKQILMGIFVTLIASGIIWIIRESFFPGYNYHVGDTLFFGSYEQDNDLNNGAEPIEWYILANENGRYLLLSKYILDAKKYNEQDVAVSWETCTLRTWLNEEFIDCAFSEKEQGKIVNVLNENPDNVEEITAGGNATFDCVFLLSVPEAKKYLSIDNGLGYSTEYAISQGAVALDPYDEIPYQDENVMRDALAISKLTRRNDESEEIVMLFWVKSRNSFWALRTPGWKQNTIAHVRNRRFAELFSDISELIDLSGSTVDYEMMGIRPAIWYEP